VLLFKKLISHPPKIRKKFF